MQRLPANGGMCVGREKGWGSAEDCSETTCSQHLPLLFIGSLVTQRPQPCPNQAPMYSTLPSFPLPRHNLSLGTPFALVKLVKQDPRTGKHMTCQCVLKHMGGGGRAESRTMDACYPPILALFWSLGLQLADDTVARGGWQTQHREGEGVQLPTQTGGAGGARRRFAEAASEGCMLAELARYASSRTTVSAGSTSVPRTQLQGDTVTHIR